MFEDNKTFTTTFTKKGFISSYMAYGDWPSYWKWLKILCKPEKTSWKHQGADKYSDRSMLMFHVCKLLQPPNGIQAVRNKPNYTTNE